MEITEAGFKLLAMGHFSHRFNIKLQYNNSPPLQAVFGCDGTVRIRGTHKIKIKNRIKNDLAQLYIKEFIAQLFNKIHQDTLKTSSLGYFNVSLSGRYDQSNVEAIFVWRSLSSPLPGVVRDKTEITLKLSGKKSGGLLIDGVLAKHPSGTFRFVPFQNHPTNGFIAEMRERAGKKMTEEQLKDLHNTLKLFLPLTDGSLRAYRNWQQAARKLEANL